MELDREQQEIAQTAARLIVEDGLDYATARRKAMQEHGGGRRLRETPSNEAIEDEVRAHIAIFHADTQPAELVELRRIAAVWMERLAAFRPHLTGAVWRGTATRLSRISIDLFCDDSKSAEIALIDMRVDYDVGSVDGPRGRVFDVLSFHAPSQALGMPVRIALTVRDYDDLRGALHRDARGRSERGDLAALRQLGSDA